MYVSRIERSYARFGARFLDRILGEQEKEIFARRYARDPQRGYRFLATRFAAKEAVLKSLGRGWLQGISFQDIEIKNDSRGKPFVQLGERASAEARRQGVKTFELSLSHTKELAAAYVIALGEG